MTKLITRIIVTAFALALVAEVVPGIEVSSVGVALLVALVLGIVNGLIRPLVIVLTLPITILTLGLFIFIINAFLFWFVASFIDGFTVTGFFPALVGSVVVSLISTFVNKHLK